MDDKKKLLGVFALILLLFLISAFWWFFEGRYTTKIATKEAPATEAPAAVTRTFSVTETVDYGEEVASVSAEISAKDGESVLELLENSHQTIVKKYSFGTMVESIDGVANGKEGKYWIYYVNGKAAEVGADQYKLKPGDVVEWRFEEAKQ